MNRLVGRLSGLTERCWFLLALFASVLLGFFFTRGQFALLVYFVVPWAISLFYLQLRRRALRGDAPMLLLAAASVLMVCSALWNRSRELMEVLGMSVAGAYALVVSAPPKDMDPLGQRRELSVVAALLVACITPMMLLGVSTVFTGTPVHFFREHIPVGIRDRGNIEYRIWVLSHPNITARGALIAILFAIYGICVVRSKWLKALLGVCIAVLTLAVVHTQSRTCFIAYGVAMGALVFRALWLRLPDRKWKIPAALAAWAAVALAVLAGLNLIYTLDIRIASALLPPMETAPNGVTRAAKEGAFDVFSNGRDLIWKYCWRYLRSHPIYFLTGMGPGDVMAQIATQIPEAANYAHLHNSLIDCLARGGVPFLLCILGYLVLMVRPSLAVLTARESAEEKGLFIMPVMLGMLLVMSLTEAMLFVNVSLSNGVFFLACGHVLCADRRRKRDER